MILGMSVATYTTIHVIISLIAIVAGLIVAVGMARGRVMRRWTMLFLVTTILTSVTGFGFPNETVTPGIIVGILSLAALAVALFALYIKHDAGAWRWIYVISAIVALWFNLFVLIVQSFQKIAFLRALAPTQSEPPFQIAQVVVLGIVIALAVFGVRKYRPATVY